MTRSRPSDAISNMPQRFDHRGGRSRDGLETTLDGLFLVTLGVAPLVQGGRTDLGRVVYFACVGMLAMAWMLRQHLHRDSTYRISGLEWLLVVGLGLLVLQVVPLPATWISRLAPSQANWLPLWNGGQDVVSARLGLPRWSQLSFTPHATRMGILVYIAHAMLFVVSYQRLRDLASIEHMLRIIAVTTGGMTVFGLIQYLSGTHRYAWYFEHPSRDAAVAVTGPFPNPNHFAHFLALGVGSLIWWLHRSFQSESRTGPTGNRFVARDRQGQAQVAMIALATTLGAWALAGCLSRSRG
ncbi:MAG TPA: hypothetical protein VIY86_04255, partial [Pirellulaceae bacterium]